MQKYIAVDGQYFKKEPEIVDTNLTDDKTWLTMIAKKTCNSQFFELWINDFSVY